MSKHCMQIRWGGSQCQLQPQQWACHYPASPSMPDLPSLLSPTHSEGSELWKNDFCTESAPPSQFQIVLEAHTEGRGSFSVIVSGTEQAPADCCLLQAPCCKGILVIKLATQPSDTAARPEAEEQHAADKVHPMLQLDAVGRKPRQYRGPVLGRASKQSRARRAPSATRCPNVASSMILSPLLE